MAVPELWFLRSCLWRLPSQAKLPLHDGWRRTWQMCHCSWNVKSTIRKAELPQHKPGSPWENWSLQTTSQLHLLRLRNLYLGPFQTLRAGGCPKVVILAQLPLLWRCGPKWAKQQTQLGRTLVVLHVGWHRTRQICHRHPPWNCTGGVGPFQIVERRTVLSTKWMGLETGISTKWSEQRNTTKRPGLQENSWFLMNRENRGYIDHVRGACVHAKRPASFCRHVLNTRMG